MFGMGFTEILIIAVIAILFMGPDKLPTAMVEIAKFFRTVKKTISSVKDTFEEELNVNEIKQEALAYKKELLDASEKLNKVTDIQGTIAAELTNLSDDIVGDDTIEPQKKETPKQETPKQEKVTFEKKSKKEKKPKKEENIDV